MARRSVLQTGRHRQVQFSVTKIDFFQKENDKKKFDNRKIDNHLTSLLTELNKKINSKHLNSSNQ